MYSSIHTHAHTHTHTHTHTYVYVYVCAQALSGVRLFVTPWTVAPQAPLPMGFPKQDYWSALPCLLGDLSNRGSNVRLLHWQVDSLPLHHLGKPYMCVCLSLYIHISVCV